MRALTTAISVLLVASFPFRAPAAQERLNGVSNRQTSGPAVQSDFPHGGLPPDAGQLDVKAYGAAGDGHTDDTQAILRALADTTAGPDREHILYFPAGTYLVSDTLLKRGPDSRYTNGIFIHGEDERTTTVKLKDDAIGFGDLKNPKSVIFTSSKLYNQGTPTSGGKDWIGKGEGNEAFRNFITDISIDVGHGNKGAIAIDFLANNLAAIRNVRITAPAGSGHTGIAMTRRWPGPSLVSEVSINGFETAMHVDHAEYGIVIENLSIAGQHQIGVINDGNVLSMHNFHSENSVTALANTNANGLIALWDGELDGGAPDRNAIENAGAIVLHDVASSGYRSVLSTRQGIRRIVSYAESAPGRSVPPSPRLFERIGRPSASLQEPVASWVSVRQFGAAGDGRTDDTLALQRAFRSSARTLYLPFGEYVVSGVISPGPSLRRVIGMMSSLILVPSSAGPPNRPILAIEHGSAPLTIESLRLLARQEKDLDHASLEVSSADEVTLRDIQFYGAIRRAREGGMLFLEDVCCGTLDLSGPAPVWARQLNTEGEGTRVIVRGTPLWILGLKTEGANTAIAIRDFARTEVIGGLLYPVATVPPDRPVFDVKDSRLAATIAESAYTAGAAYTLLLTGLDGSTSVTMKMEFQPTRGLARMVPSLGFPP